MLKVLAAVKRERPCHGRTELLRLVGESTGAYWNEVTAAWIESARLCGSQALDQSRQRLQDGVCEVETYFDVDIISAVRSCLGEAHASGPNLSGIVFDRSSFV